MNIVNTKYKSNDSKLDIDKTKKFLIDELIKEVEIARGNILNELKFKKEEAENLFHIFIKSKGSEREMHAAKLDDIKQRIFELETLYVNPFFAKVFYIPEKDDVDDEIPQTRLIAKFPFSEYEISSWTSPIANLRFKDLGKTDFKLEDGIAKYVDLKEKDKYVINESKLIYFSKEDEVNGSNIIYEDFFSNNKNEYGLSEIISKIEKEQFEIVQLKANIPLIISGPAGSGKTTICLHRVAYLLQSPETEKLFLENKILMLVQDISTKEYFSSILPKLGIKRMDIMTFFEWAKGTLNLPKIKEIEISSSDTSYFDYLESKNSLLFKIQSINISNGSVLNSLNTFYKNNLAEKEYLYFFSNSEKQKFDYLDIVYMLNIATRENAFYKKIRFDKHDGGGKLKSYTKKIKIEYSMIIIDEFQNYTQDELDIVSNCIDENTKAITCIGDLNQQNTLKIQSKKHNSNYFNRYTKVHLSKVFRNTKQILEFVKDSGYEIEVPENSRSGEEVEVSHLKNDVSMLIQFLGSKLKKINENMQNDNIVIGVLCDNALVKNYLLENLNEFISKNKNIKVMTKRESQGTEFHTVFCIDGIWDIFLEKKLSKYSYFSNVEKSNNYIGYTRAMEKLYVLKI